MLLCSAVLAGCGGDAGSDAPGALNVVSLGDSLAVGVQPQLLGSDRATTQGYPRLLVRKLRDQGRDVKLHELGCGAATSTSVINGGLECAPERDTPYENEDPTNSQLAYAEGLLSTLGDAPTIVVLDIGGNDVGACLESGAVSTRCVRKAADQLRKNLKTILSRLRAVAPETPIAVLDLYDPFLGLWKTHPEGRTVMASTHRMFLSDVNGTIARVSKAEKTTLAPLGEAMDQGARLTPRMTAEPQAVAAVCEYTWMCVDPPMVPNIHLRRDGYDLAAAVLLRALTPLLPPVATR